MKCRQCFLLLTLLGAVHFAVAADVGSLPQLDEVSVVRLGASDSNKQIELTKSTDIAPVLDEIRRIPSDQWQAWSGKHGACAVRLEISSKGSISVFYLYPHGKVFFVPTPGKLPHYRQVRPVSELTALTAAAITTHPPKRCGW
jgi:hypothetical protein